MTVPASTPHPRPSWRKACRAVVAALALAAAGCGGGTSTLDPFEPSRVLVFGDDMSLVGPTGRKVGINALDSTDTTNQTVACAASPVWSQYVALAWGMALAECNPAIETTPRARMFAARDATVAQVAAALDAYRGANTLARGDLFTVSGGMHDVLAAYRRVDAGSANESQAVDQVEAAARELTRAINAVADANGRLVFVTVPDLSLSPYARAEDAAKGGGRAELIGRLVAAFNTELRLTVQNNGRRLGIVKADEIMQGILVDIARGTSTITNVSDAACDPAKYNPGNDPAVDVSACTSATLTTAATNNSGAVMWAGGIHLSPVLHSLLGAAAFSTSTSNPF